MAVDNRKPWEHPEVALANERQYLVGYVASLALLGLSLLLVEAHVAHGVALLSVISVLAWLTVMVQLILLFHLDFSETQRWNSFTLLLNVPLLVLSVGLTSWMFSQLYTHVMAPAVMPH